MSCRFCGETKHSVRVVACNATVTYACGTSFFPTDHELGEPFNSCWSRSKECKEKATATNPSEMQARVERLSALEAEAKQARDDEEWAHLHAVVILRRGDVWVAEHFDGSQVRDAEGPTIAAALRALREKVEGGAR